MIFYTLSTQKRSNSFTLQKRPFHLLGIEVVNAFPTLISHENKNCSNATGTASAGEESFKIIHFPPSLHLCKLVSDPATGTSQFSFPTPRNLRPA